MSKRIAALLLALTLVLTTLSTAFAWSCPSCGAEMSGNFCSECGTKKPAENICPSCGTNHGEKSYAFCPECGAKLGAAAPAAATTAPAEEPAISEIFENGDGTVSVLWNADGTSMYQVRYILKQSDNPEADKTAANSIGYWYHESDIGFFTLGMLMPGQAYWIGVFDQAGRGHYVPFEPSGTVENFSAFDNELYCWPVLRQDGKDTEVDSFTTAQFATGSGAECGLFVAMEYNNPGEVCEPVVQIAIEAPNGAKKVIYATNVTIKPQTSDVAGWSFASLKDYAGIMEKYFGGMLTGEHKVTVYLDGKLLGRASFLVEDAATGAMAPSAPAAAAATAAPTAAAEEAVNIVDIAANADGTVSVVWTGGSAPYTVRYVVKRSDSYQDDVKYEQGTGRWIATDECMETSYVLTELAPGRDYWISVLSSSGEGRYAAYEAPDAPMFTDFTTYLEVTPRSRVGEAVTDLTCLPLDLIGVEDDTEHGAFIHLKYANTGSPRTVFYQLVLTLPNGALMVNYDDFVELGTGESRYVGWEYRNLEGYFNYMRNRFGGFTQGDILVEVYLDGKLAGSGAIPLGTASTGSSGGLNLSSGQTVAAPEILSVVENSDATVTVTWKDNGKGPFDVDYVVRHSDDIEADKDVPGSYWSDASDVEGTSHVMEYFVPGCSYWIIVTDSTGAESVAIHQMAAAGASDLGMSITLRPRRDDNGTYTDLEYFSQAVLNQDHTESYGMYFDMDYKGRSEDWKPNGMFLLTMPNGESLVLRSGSINMFAAGSTYWECYNLDWAFGRMKSWYGSVPAGEYRLDVYIDGEYAASSSFKVQ